MGNDYDRYEHNEGAMKPSCGEESFGLIYHKLTGANHVAFRSGYFEAELNKKSWC